DLLDNLHADALKAIEERGREGEVGDTAAIAEKVALGALHYYLLQVAPVKDMLFDPAESLSFTGNTGPYLQYMGARIASILRKAGEQGLKCDGADADVSLLGHESEWALLKDLQRFPELVAKAAESLDPSIIAVYLYDVCKDFSAFYRDCPIVAVAEQNRPLALARLTLADCTLTVLKNAMDLVLVPYLDRM
ncbi:MAG: arginine--tRNA ligase, partial [Treponema sp.]|nr:arginine--tRNA ligase [Treponema sp.]